MKYESLEATKKNDVPGPPTVLHARAADTMSVLLPSPEIGPAQDPQILLLQIIPAHTSALTQDHFDKEDLEISGDVSYLPRSRPCDLVSCAHLARGRKTIIWLLGTFNVKL